MLKGRAVVILATVATGSNTIEDYWKRPADRSMLAMCVVLIVDLIKDFSLAAILVNVPGEIY